MQEAQFIPLELLQPHPIENYTASWAKVAQSFHSLKEHHLLVNQSGDEGGRVANLQGGAKDLLESQLISR